MEPDPTEMVISPSLTRRSVAVPLLRLIAVSAILAALLFIPAGRPNWLQAWLFWAVFTAFLIFYGLWAMRGE